MGKSWSQLTEESIQRLSLPGEPKKANTGKLSGKSDVKEIGDLDVKGLIKEAERIKGLLDRLESSLS